MTRPRYGERKDGVQRFWDVSRLWALAKALPVEEIAVSSLSAPDAVCWFYPGGPAPTVRAIAEHCRRINAADLSYPILLGPGDRVLDGMHRIARAIIEERQTIPAQRFPTMPSPDEMIDLSP